MSSISTDWSINRYQSSQIYQSLSIDYSGDYLLTIHIIISLTSKWILHVNASYSSNKSIRPSSFCPVVDTTYVSVDLVVYALTLCCSFTFLKTAPYVLLWVSADNMSLQCVILNWVCSTANLCHVHFSACENTNDTDYVLPFWGEGPNRRPRGIGVGMTTIVHLQ